LAKYSFDFIQRKIGVLDLLGEHDIARASESAQQLKPART